jgi:hypothetical protein
MRYVLTGALKRGEKLVSSNFADTSTVANRYVRRVRRHLSPVLLEDLSQDSGENHRAAE